MKPTLKEKIKHIWASIWQTCDTCTECDLPLSTECQMCRSGKPMWRYDWEKARKRK